MAKGGKFGGKSNVRILKTAFSLGIIVLEHHVRNVGVESSNLFFSTIKIV